MLEKAEAGPNFFKLYSAARSRVDQEPRGRRFLTLRPLNTMKLLHRDQTNVSEPHQVTFSLCSYGRLITLLDGIVTATDKFSYALH